MSEQAMLFGQDEIGHVIAVLVKLLEAKRQPSAWEVLEEVEKEVGFGGRFQLEPALEQILYEGQGTTLDRSFFESLLRSADLQLALHGDAPPRHEAESTIDALIHASTVYGNSGKLQEAVNFMARFKNYSPFNNMLVWLQHPSCSFYATRKDWKDRFSRVPKRDARPMIILAPMHPVLLVYDLDQTEGPPLPEHLTSFASATGAWNPSWWRLSTENAAKDAIRVSVRELAFLRAGYAARVASTVHKMLVVISEGLDEASRFGTLCHELAHIYLGHLGSDEDYWWPSRSGLDRRSMEVEAEAAAFIVTSRLGLKLTSAEYVSAYLEGGKVPAGVSLDLIAKVAGRIENMAIHPITRRKQKREENAATRA